jgi:single-strand DNA-binding protein
MVNKAQLIGNVGADPEVKPLNNGGKVVNFRMATSENYKDKEGNRKETTEWHRLVAFGNVADIVEKYVRKGNQIFVEGKIQTRDWEDKDKNKRQTTEILVQTIKLLGKKSGDTAAAPVSESAASDSTNSGAKKTAPAKSEKTATASAPPLSIPESDDDLPF